MMIIVGRFEKLVRGQGFNPVARLGNTENVVKKLVKEVRFLT